MGWFGFGRTRNEDPEVRLAAVQGMTDQGRLAALAKDDGD
ncbi:MAG: hypothetical protein RLZZ127_2402, partial [Planctomycetota bacterium]